MTTPPGTARKAPGIEKENEMFGPFDKLHEQLEEAYDKGELTDKEFREEERGLREEQRQEAQDAAEETYNDRMGW